MNTSQPTGMDFLEFFKWAGKKGEIKPATAHSLGVGCSQVLKCTDNWETLDMRTLNAEDAFRRFVNKRSKEFKTATLTAYKNRFKTGLAMFLEYIHDPSAWKPQLKNRSASHEGDADVGIQEKANNSLDFPLLPQSDVAQLSTRAALPQQTSSLSSFPLVEYPFPLREGRLIYLKLPADLRVNEVKRLAIYLNSLAVDLEVNVK